MTVDLGHNKLMEGYVASLVHTPEQVDVVCHAMRVTGRLYAAMVGAGMAQADQPERYAHGVLL